jgi:hypothetical protein
MQDAHQSATEDNHELGEVSSNPYNSRQRKTLATVIIAKRTTRIFFEFETPQVFFIPKMQKCYLFSGRKGSLIGIQRDSLQEVTSCSESLCIPRW